LYEVILDAKYNAALYIPTGYAHGFESVVSDSLVVYISTNSYAPSAERAYCPYIEHFESFSWQGSAHDLLVSDKDREAPKFEFGPSSRHLKYVADQWVEAGVRPQKDINLL